MSAKKQNPEAVAAATRGERAKRDRLYNQEFSVYSALAQVHIMLVGIAGAFAVSFTAALIGVVGVML
jgi:hypothetical protein